VIGIVRSKQNFIVLIYFLLLFGILLGIFWPTFSNPPRSDYWCLFYHFQDYQELPVLERVMEVVNYDVWEHGTYRPLFHLVLYWLWLSFGANYFWYHLLTFGFYCLNILLLYRLSRQFGCGRVISAAFLTVFAFLFSHFDIVAWTFHLALIIGFSLCLSGFLLFIRFLRTGRSGRLILSSLLFFPGLLSYELFILWPLGMVILSFIKSFLPVESRNRRRLRRGAVLSVISLYLAYGAVIGYTRSYSPVEGSGEVMKKLIRPSRITFSLAASSSAIILNGVLSNIAPIMTCPVIIQDNVGRGGIFLECSPPLRDALARRSGERIFNLIEPPLIIDKKVDLDSLWQMVGAELEKLVNIIGMISLLIMVGGCYLIYRKDRSGALMAFFFFFLVWTSVFALYHGRGITNVPLYVFRQFRYQYVPNAMVIILALFLIDRLIKAHKKARLIVYIILSGILLINLVVLTAHISILDQQMAPLRKMLFEIESGLEDGRITSDKKLYLDDRIADRLPSLCWNGGMARFMKGTYQWIFSPQNQNSFTIEKNQAGWVIDKKDLSLNTK
jgi:hypothetical protein